jgi:tetratricopeptide (TPR) repeat protein
MVLPAPPAHTPPVEPHWFDDVVLAIELSAHGVLTLVDHAAPSRLRQAFLRLRARDAATDLIVDVQRLATLPPGATVILAMAPSITTDALDWLNLNRPVIADRRLNLVLWCEGDAAATLARRAPDFFDWISARVDCPPAPAAFAVADVKAAIRARAPGIAWAGPGLEETLAAVRPGRPVRRVAVASYQSMIDALTSRERGWLFLEGISTAFHLRRLQWAMAESGRRVIVLRPSIAWHLPGWSPVQAEHMQIVEAVLELTAAGGTGRLVALTGLDPAACAYAAYLLHHGSESARLEEFLATSPDPRAAVLELARTLEWPSAGEDAAPQNAVDHGTVDNVFDRAVARQRQDEQRALLMPPDGNQWVELGTAALAAGDPEVAIRWLSRALQAGDTSPSMSTFAVAQRGRALSRAAQFVAARSDLERAYMEAKQLGDSWLIALSAAALGDTLRELGEPQRAREALETALNTNAYLGAEDAAGVMEALARTLLAQDDLTQARMQLERALTLRRSARGTDEDPSIAISLTALGTLLAEQGDPEGAMRVLAHSLAIWERLGSTREPAIAITLRNLAVLRWQSGDAVEASSHLHRALELQYKMLGPEHPAIADTLVALARVLAASGDLAAAQSALQDALGMQQRAFRGDGQLAGATTRRELAKVLAAQGNLTGAIANLQHVLATQRRILERDDHPDVAATLRELERLQALQRDVQRPD